MPIFSDRIKILGRHKAISDIYRTLMPSIEGIGKPVHIVVCVRLKYIGSSLLFEFTFRLESSSTRVRLSPGAKNRISGIFLTTISHERQYDGACLSIKSTTCAANSVTGLRQPKPIECDMPDPIGEVLTQPLFVLNSQDLTIPRK